MNTLNQQPIQNNNADDRQITIEALYPQLTPEQQAEADYYLFRYLEVIRGIFERTSNLTE